MLLGISPELIFFAGGFDRFLFFVFCRCFFFFCGGGGGGRGVVPKSERSPGEEPQFPGLAQPCSGWFHTLNQGLFGGFPLLLSTREEQGQQGWTFTWVYLLLGILVWFFLTGDQKDNHHVEGSVILRQAHEPLFWKHTRQT